MFAKEYFVDYSEHNIRFLADNIKDKEFVLSHADIGAEFSKLRHVIKRLQELGYDAKSFFKRKELMDKRHWTEIVGDLIRHHKAQFITSSTLKHNLKKEGISIQNIRGEFKVEMR